MGRGSEHHSRCLVVAPQSKMSLPTNSLGNAPTSLRDSQSSRSLSGPILSRLGTSRSSLLTMRTGSTYVLHLLHAKSTCALGVVLEPSATGMVVPTVVEPAQSSMRPLRVL